MVSPALFRHWAAPPTATKPLRVYHSFVRQTAKPRRQGNAGRQGAEGAWAGSRAQPRAKNSTLNHTCVPDITAEAGLFPLIRRRETEPAQSPQSRNRDLQHGVMPVVPNVIHSRAPSAGFQRHGGNRTDADVLRFRYSLHFALVRPYDPTRCGNPLPRAGAARARFPFIVSAPSSLVSVAWP